MKLTPYQIRVRMGRKNHFFKTAKDLSLFLLCSLSNISQIRRPPMPAIIRQSASPGNISSPSECRTAIRSRQCRRLPIFSGPSYGARMNIHSRNPGPQYGSPQGKWEHRRDRSPSTGRLPGVTISATAWSLLKRMYQIHTSLYYRLWINSYNHAIPSSARVTTGFLKAFASIWRIRSLVTLNSPTSSGWVRAVIQPKPQTEQPSALCLSMFPKPL